MSQNNKKIVKILLFIILIMILITLASVPLYDMFCKITGYGGATSYKSSTEIKPNEKEVIIQFDANVSKNLPWEFYPLENKKKVKLGETVLTYFYAKNNSKHDIIGTSIYNVSPQKVGQYFIKIQCFCFEEQLLRSKEAMKMPVLFTIDPAMGENVETNEVKLLTLSYTFFKVRDFKKQ